MRQTKTNYTLEQSDLLASFAPVVIPTLCRYEHFRKCLESLMECTHAEKTDVYVGVDYPAKESHWEGYKLILEYLDSIADNHGFKSLNVIRRERNYGVGKDSNFYYLCKYVFSFSETLIATEDDNIFSPAFLDFANKGLVKFKDDPSVLGINGYRHYYDVLVDDNSFFRQNVDFSAWGYAIWRNRVKDCVQFFNDKRVLRKSALNPLSWIRLYRNGLNRYLNYVALLRAESIIITDNALSTYMGIKQMDVIMPAQNLVRNIGWDNSGENCKNNPELAKIHLNQSIADYHEFQFRGSGFEHYNQNKKIYRRQSYGRISISDLLKKIVTKLRSL